MKVFILGVFLGLVATVWSAPIDNKLNEVKSSMAIVRSISENNPGGTYSFEGEDGRTKDDESGPQFEDLIGYISSESDSYVSADGTPINVDWNWTLNEKGFVDAEGHLQSPPWMLDDLL